MNFIARWLATAVAVAAAAWIVPGIDIVGGDNAWIIIAVFALVVLYAYSDAQLFAKLCGTVLICMCLAGQWLRYRKMK